MEPFFCSAPPVDFVQKKENSFQKSDENHSGLLAGFLLSRGVVHRYDVVASDWFIVERMPDRSQTPPPQKRSRLGSFDGGNGGERRGRDDDRGDNSSSPLRSRGEVQAERQLGDQIVEAVEQNDVPRVKALLASIPHHTSRQRILDFKYSQYVRFFFFFYVVPRCSLLGACRLCTTVAHVDIVFVCCCAPPNVFVGAGPNGLR